MLGYHEIRKEIEEGSVFVKDEPISEASEGEQDDGNDCEDDETIRDEQEQENVEDHHERDTSTNPVEVKTTYRNCAYCFENTDRTDMVAVPRTAARRKQYIDVLGKQFESYIKNRKTPFLCKKHFDDGESLPKAEAIYNNRKLEKIPRRRASNRIILSKCCYCGAKSSRKVMRSVPTNPGKRELWIQILGEQFRENLKTSVHGGICNSHFPESLVSATGKVSSFALPIPFGESPNQTATAFPITCNMECKCAYCGKHDLIVKMVPVPEGLVRDSWCYILGKRFTMNLKILEHLYVCSSHFQDEKPTKDSIPFADDSIEYKESDNIPLKKLRRYTCTYCRGLLKIEHTVAVYMTPFRLETWSDVLGEEFEFRMFETGTLRLCRIHFRKEDFVNKKFQKIKDDAIPIPMGVSQRKQSSDITNLKQCLYCKKFEKYRNMRRIPYDEGRWPIFIEVFGLDFVESFLKEENNLPAVCRIHLTEKGLPLRVINLQELERMAVEPQVDLSQVKEEPMDEHEAYESNTPGCSTEPENMCYYSTNELSNHNYAGSS